MGTLTPLLVHWSLMADISSNIPVSRGVSLGLEVISNTTNDDRTDCPEHLQHLGRRRSQSHWYNLGAISRSIGDENAPWDAFQNLRGEEHALAVGEIEDEDEAVQGHKTTDGRPTVADCRGDGTSEEATDESADWASALKGRLPGGFDDVFATDRAQNAKVLGKLLRGDELSHQEDAVRFHDLIAC
jgi:hypothetical protein